MKKHLFNYKGIRSLQQTLYALPDLKLAEEVFIVRLNFKDWIKSKFEFNKKELKFIDQISKNLLGYAALKLSNTIAQRQPINFTILEINATKENLD